ncbi:MAG: choice-of-anchor Q domain-containing protein, partial [Lentisphaeria bacterium]
MKKAIQKLLRIVPIYTFFLITLINLEVIANEVPVFIILGQSNADGSAKQADATEDDRLDDWYTTDQNKANELKIWFRNCKYAAGNPGSGDTRNLTVDGDDQTQNGWKQLWYKNDIANGRTTMNQQGTSGTLADNGVARGIEGEFGKTFKTKFPDNELYVMKLGCSGSTIGTWLESLNGTNWRYFRDNVFTPAIQDLLDKGKTPVLTGIWWMQGCANRTNTQEYYTSHLNEFIAKCREELGFVDAPIYVGRISAPGESLTSSSASTQYGVGVRNAQNSIGGRLIGASSEEFVPGTDKRVTLVDNRDAGFSTDNLHYSYKGYSLIGERLAEDIATQGRSNWSSFTMPGTWANLTQLNTDLKEVTFSPRFKATEVDLEFEISEDNWENTQPKTDGTYNVRATVTYNNVEEVKTAVLTINSAVFVKNGATGSGTSWNDATGNLKTAIENAGVAPVYIANGTYDISETITVPAGVLVEGGYLGTIDGSFEKGAKTIINHKGSGAVVILAKGTASSFAKISDCTIQGATSGRGVTLNDYAVVDNCIIQNNTTTGNVVNVDDGAGVSFIGVYSKVINSKILNNTSAYIGGGVAVNTNYAELINCLVEGNKCLGNASSAGAGGILQWSSTISFAITNCTVTNNNGTNNGAAWLNGSNSTADITNTVFYGNKVNGTINPNSEYNQNGTTFTNFASSKQTTGETNILLTEDPFNDSANKDYTPKEGSTLINAGDNKVVISDFDLNGNTRIWNNGVVDIGAYEYQQAGVLDVNYIGVTDILIDGTFPEIKVNFSGNVNPKPVWKINYHELADCSDYPVNPSSSVAKTYYVQAVDEDDHWIASSKEEIRVVSSLNGFYINDKLIACYEKGRTITNIVNPESGKFIESLSYTGLDNKSSTFGGKYSFTMPNNDVKITVNELDITPIRYVSVDGSGDKNGYSWNNAAAGAAGLGTALTAAAVAGSKITEIRVAGGNYPISATLTIPAEVTLSGGWNSVDGSRPQAENSRPWEFTSQTNITGDNLSFSWTWSNSAWKVSGGSGRSSFANLATINGIVDGIVFSDVLFDNPNPVVGITVTGGTLKNSIATRIYRGGSSTANDAPASLLVNGSSSQIIDSYFGGNVNIRSHSAASIVRITSLASNTLIKGCTFNQNQTAAGGVCKVEAEGITFDDCIFTNNIINHGSYSVCAYNKSVIVNNSIFANNSQGNSGTGPLGENDGNDGSPVFKSAGASGNIIATNCTIVNNKRLGDSTLGTIAMLSNGGQLSLTNCVMWGNTGNGTSTANPLVSKNSTQSVTFNNCAYDTTLTTNATTVTNSVNIAQATNNAPGFVTESLLAAGVGSNQASCDAVLAYDLSLNSTSSLINAGDNANIAEDAKDLAGNERIAASDADSNPKVDIGAYEYVNFEYTKTDDKNAPTITPGSNFEVNFIPSVFTGASSWKYEVSGDEITTTTGIATSNDGSFKTASITGLKEEINYQLRVAAVNANGVIISNWSEAAKVVVTGA